ncbi:MAG: cupin [Betaproteobacteria bacterium]|nr:cupin [Betaproteobacteria bacterium]
MKINLPSDLHQLLGGLSPDTFLKKYWQKKPLLIRRAVPDVMPPVTRAELFELAGREEAESRVVAHEGRAWRMERGPFTKRALPAQRQPHRTLLVQGVNLHSVEADALMRRFNFIPQSRLDDLMISWASDGGGVGPHFDSYDVFLLQVAGKRRWRISSQRDLTLQPGVPLKILKNFKAEEEYVLEPGDMLYLPPSVAHDGVAVGECMTCSIGFRAPSAAELTRGFLEYMAEQVQGKGLYADPGLAPTRASALLDDGFVRRARGLVTMPKPGTDAFEDFLGLYLTEPKPNVFFDAPDEMLAPAAFAHAAARQGVHLDLQTQMLYRGQRIYVNGEGFALPAGGSGTSVRALADARSAAPGQLAAAAAKILHPWYEYGWLHLGGKP